MKQIILLSFFFLGPLENVELVFSAAIMTNFIFKYLLEFDTFLNDLCIQLIPIKLQDAEMSDQYFNQFFFCCWNGKDNGLLL